MDNANVCVEGNPNQIDSFVACIAAVLRAWEQPVGYEWIAGLAGVAFSPMLDPSEDCTAWWMEAGSDQRIGFLGKALGFDVDRVTRESPWDADARATYAETGLLPAPHESHFARLRAAFDRGDAVILRTWPAWSVLTAWAQEIDELGFATVPGFEALVAEVWGPAQAQLAYVLSPADVEMAPEVALKKALSFGARVAGGHGPRETLGYGPALYAVAAERIDGDHFCTSCGSDGDSCAHRTLMRMLGTQQSAVGFLEDAATLAGAGVPWGTAIEAYDAMVAITSAYCGWEAFHTAWPNAHFRRQLREDLLTLAGLQVEAAAGLKTLSTVYAAKMAA